MFRVLVKHFARRLAQSGGEESGDVDMSLGAGLALLAAPGVFIAIGLLDRYSSLLNYFRGVPIIQDNYPRAVGDGYGLLVFSMAVTGLVTLWKWDRILPDPADRLNLGPLPIPERTVFLSSLAAIALVVGVFILDVNAGSMFLFPMVVTADQQGILPFLKLLSAHLVVLILGSLFTFCACFSLMGALVALSPPAWFSGLSLVLRSVSGFALLAMWLTSGQGRGWMRLARSGAASWQQWVPPVWFASLYGPLVGRPDVGIDGLWQRGLAALGIAFLLAMGGYAVGYRRGMDGRLARSAKRRKWPRWLLTQGSTPLERAAFRFSLQTLWRSERHSLLVVALLGSGLVFGVMQGDAERIPFYAGFSLIVALRIAFSVPALPAANWPFRLLAVAREGEPAQVARRLLWMHFALLVVVPTAVLCPPAVTLVLFLIHAVLIEALLLDFRQIPFTVRPPGFRSNRLVHALLALTGMGLIPWAGGHVAQSILVMPIRALLPCAAAFLLVRYRHHAVEAVTSGKPPLVFEDGVEDVIRLRL